MNLSLWGSETWSVNENDLLLREDFYHEAISRVLGMSTKQVVDEKLKISKSGRNLGACRLSLNHGD